MKTSAPLALLLLAAASAFAEGKPLQTAEITTIINEVRVAKSQAAPKPASIGEAIRPNEAVITGAKSRAELVFSDKTLARLGANTQFTFIPGSRTTEINQGTVLLQVPKGAGGAQVKTAAVTAAVTGTTIMVEYFPNNFIKLIVLEGTLRVSLVNRLGESILLEAGKMLIVDPKATRLPDPVDVDLKKLVKTSKLIAGMGGPGELDFGLINDEIAEQNQRKLKGQLLDTNILIAGSGTELVLVDADILTAIQNAINAGTFTSTGSTPPPGPNPPGPNPPPPNFATITSPNPFPLGPNSIVSTNPTITNGPDVFHGASRTASGNAEDTAFIFGTSNPGPDAFLGGYSLNPGTPFAAFRFAGLDLLGTPIIQTPTGVTHLALASESTLTFTPGTYTFTPLTSLFFGSVQPLIVPSNISFNNPNLDLTFYARGPDADLVFEGTANTRTLALRSTGDLTYGANAAFSGFGLEMYALGDVFIQNGATATQFIDVVAGTTILLNPDMMTPLSAPFIFLEQLAPAGTLTLHPYSLHPTQFLEARAHGIFVADFLPFSLRLFAGSGGISVAQPEGYLSLFNLNVLEITNGGSLTAGAISFNNIGLANISGNVQIEAFLRGDVPVTFTVGGSMSAFIINFDGFDQVDVPHGGTLTLNLPEALFGEGGIESLSFNGAFGTTFGGDGGTFTLNANTINFDGFFGTLDGGAGDSAATGGAGGTLTLTANGDILINGSASLEALGGFQGDYSDLIVGGPGGSITITSNNGSILGSSPLYLGVRGGSADLEGGDGGQILIRNLGTGPINLTQLVIETNGGDGAQRGGSGGSVVVQAVGGSLTIGPSSDFNLRGGEASADEGISGHGGSVTLSALTDLSLNEISVNASGGNFTGYYSGLAGQGGHIHATATSPTAGHVQVTQTTLTANGGSASGYGIPGNGGSVTLESLRQSGSGITVNNSSTLRALASFAASTGGFISLETNGADIAISESTLEASGGIDDFSQILVTIPDSATAGHITIDNAYLSADILRIGALSPDGVVTISNNSTLTASDTLKIYGGTSNGMVRFTGGGTITLNGGGTAEIRAHTVQIDTGTTVNNDGLSATNVDATNHFYNISGYGDFTTLPSTGPAPDFFTTTVPN